MSGGTQLLERARSAYGERDWVVGRDAFAAADERAALAPADLFAWANCVWWLGEIERSLPLLRRAYRAYLEVDRPADAAIVAVDLGFTVAMRGEQAQASGWLRRAARLLDGLPEGPQHGYLRYVQLEAALEEPDLEAALAAADDIERLGARFHDPTLEALSALGRGRALLGRGEVDEGLGLLDEAMVAVVADEVEPSWAGLIYCNLMSVCEQIVDLERAGEWTAATARWCEGMAGAGPFMGICRVHRAHLLQLRGEWGTAEREVGRICEEFEPIDLEVVAEAQYERGELLRLRGDHAAAETAYLAAHRLGRDPQPGLALLALEQGRPSAAMTALDAALTAVTGDLVCRARLLPAAVQVALAVGEVGRARTWCDELDAIAATYATTGLRAEAAEAAGAVLLAEGENQAAVTVLREALTAWRRLEAPFRAARLRTVLAGGLAALGDRGGAALEREVADLEFARLGVLRAEADRDTRRGDGHAAVRLTGRETEVLALVADGFSNARIAASLVLSVRTVERHLATIYQKFGLSGRSARAAAVSHALRSGLLQRR